MNMPRPAARNRFDSVRLAVGTHQRFALTDVSVGIEDSINWRTLQLRDS